MSSAERIVDAKDGRVLCHHKKVAIIGAGPSRAEAPWDDDDYCWWALNEIDQPRADRHFELHPMDKQNERELAWLAVQSAPVYVLEPTPLVPAGVVYPLERVLDVTQGRRYFTCTFAFQVALAIAEGAETIGVWGLDLALGTTRERLVELPCVEYWLGLAEGRGIEVIIPRSSPLLRRDFLYGYDYDEELASIERECDRAVMTVPRERWPAVLQRLGTYYGGRTESGLTMAAAILGNANLTRDDAARMRDAMDVALHGPEDRGPYAPDQEPALPPAAPTPTPRIN